MELTGRGEEGLEDELLESLASKPVGKSIRSTSGTEVVYTRSINGTYGEPSRLNSYCE